jgi:hypothetical protein
MSGGIPLLRFWLFPDEMRSTLGDVTRRTIKTLFLGPFPPKSEERGVGCRIRAHENSQRIAWAHCKG